MRLDEYLDGLQPDEAADRRRLAEEKSYEILDHIEGVKDRFKMVTQAGTSFGSRSPSIFVGRSNYPTVNTGILAPIGEEDRAAEFRTDAAWYRRGLDIEDVLQYRTGLLNSNRVDTVNVHDVWDGFVGVQREVAIADSPVDVEMRLADRPELSFIADDVTTPRGPRATAETATLAENPSVPRQVEKTLSDDDWKAEGAMTYLYRRGFDVYDIRTILSAGALGTDQQRRLVPTRWSITAVDDTIGKYLRGQIRNNPSVDEVRVWVNDYIGNRYWIILAPGTWEFELVEMKSPGSIWNQSPTESVWMASAHEEFSGRTEYVEETAGAYYAARLGVLEALEEAGRQAKVLVIREVTDDYWAPVGVWQVREAVRNAFAGEGGRAESFQRAVARILPELPVSEQSIRRKSHLLAGRQVRLSDF